MNVLRMVVAEIGYRKLNFAVALAAVFVVYRNVSEWQDGVWLAAPYACIAIALAVDAQLSEAGTRRSWRAVPLLDVPDAIPFQERHLQYAKRVVIENGGNVTDRDAVVKELRRLLATIANVDTDDMSREVKRLAARAYAQHLADGQTRETRLLADTASGSDDEYFDDTPDTATGDTQPEAGVGVARLPQPLPMDEVDEWDPFGEPDIA